MGTWTLTCPSEGVYQGECSYSKEDGAFVLRCEAGVKELEPGCEIPGANPGPKPQIGKLLEKCDFTKEMVKSKEYFDPKSFRILCPECPKARCAQCPPELACATRIVIGCKKGEFVEGRCRVGTERHVIYHGKPKA